MPTGPLKSKPAITKRGISSICARLAANKRVRRNLPEWGRLHIDRQLPFLFVYRQPLKREDAGTHRLILGQASYLMTTWKPRCRNQIEELVRAVVATLEPFFGAFLIVEVWSESFLGATSPESTLSKQPAFRIVTDEDERLAPAVSRFERSFKKMRILRQHPHVERSKMKRVAPPGFRPFFNRLEAAELNVGTIGIAVNPVYQGVANGQPYPMVLRTLHRGLTRAFEQGLYEFIRSRTTHLPSHYRTLGRHAVVKAVWEVDRKLAQVSDAFDFLLDLTPTNADRAWHAFSKSRFESVPRFTYRSLPEDPVLLKRALYKVPMERIEDPTIQELFLQKQAELDRKITLLADRNTERFVHGSSQLFGVPDGALLGAAGDILAQPQISSRESEDSDAISATEFAQRAEAEIQQYRQTHSEFTAGVEVRKDVSGLLCSRGSLLIGAQTRVPLPRVEAAIQHEVGTHLLTYFNGKAQPLRQLYSGLAGYEELQEGLAVLSEYAVGGLTAGRARTLAVRVVAVQSMLDGATFIDVFRQLTESYGFTKQSAFTTAMRVFRGGGLTKDIVYLRGVLGLVDYLRNGGDLEPLLIGKVALVHAPVVRELIWRKVLRAQPLSPLWLREPEALARLAKLRETEDVANTLLRS